MGLLKLINNLFQEKEDNSLIEITNSEICHRARIREWYVYGNADFNCGYANGYVAIPPSHCLYGKDYDFVNQIEDFRIFGELTYSSMGSDINKRKDRKDFKIYKRKLPDDWWVFGFDAFNNYENSEYKQMTYNQKKHLFYCKLAKLRYLLEKYQSINYLLK